MEKKMLTMMAMVVLWAEVCCGWSNDYEGTVENLKESVNLAAEDAMGKSEAMKLKAEKAMQDSKQSAESWKKGARDKTMMEGPGSKEENAGQDDQSIVDKTREAASKATDTIHSAAQELSRYASEKVGEATNMAMGYGKVTDAYDEGKEMLDMAFDKDSGGSIKAEVMVGEVMGHGGSAFYEVFYVASDAAHGAKQTVEGAANYGRDKAADAYNLASNLLSDKLSNMKEVMEEEIDKSGGEHSQWTSNLVSDWASQKADDAHGRMIDVVGHGNEMADFAYHQTAEHMINDVSNIASENANEAKNIMTEATGNDGEWEEVKAFDDAMNKVGEAYTTARESATERLKENYEAAKEKMSQATGDLGARLRKDIADT